MKVILKKTGQVKDVPNGYAQHYLLPRGLAVVATPAAIERAQKQAVTTLKQQEKKLQQMHSLADELPNLSVVIEAVANQEGTLFGAVSESDILAAVQKHAIELRAEWLRIPEPIKHVGSYRIGVQLPDKRTSHIRLEVKQKES